MNALNYELMAQYQVEALAEGLDLATANELAAARFVADAARWARGHIGATTDGVGVAETLMLSVQVLTVDASGRGDVEGAFAIENAATDWVDMICAVPPMTAEEARDQSADRLREELGRWLREYEDLHRATGMPTGLADEAALAALMTDVMVEGLRSTPRRPNTSTMTRTFLLMLIELRRRFQIEDPDAVERFDGLARAAVSRWCLGGDQPLPVAH